AFEIYETNRNKKLPPLKIADDVDNWSKEAAEKEQQGRQFLETHDIMTVPGWVQHWTLRATPDYLRAVGFTETDDFTSPSRLNENGIRYVPEPSDKLGYFWRATAMDPRPICVHEGIPGHYFQLCLSWKHENPIRRHYYDSGPNEGIGFYSEEMMLQAGLFDDSPHTREIIYNFMRLRAPSTISFGKTATSPSRFNAGNFSATQATCRSPSRTGTKCRSIEIGGARFLP